MISALRKTEHYALFYGYRYKGSFEKSKKIFFDKPSWLKLKNSGRIIFYPLSP